MSQKPSEKWIRRYFHLAQEVANWSQDPSTKVGAVVIGDHGQILSQGYNGFARGIEDKPERLVDRSLKLKYTVHAEMNCIYNAGLSGVSLRGANLFVVGLPVCSECAKGIIQTGIRNVYMCLPDEIPDRWKESTDLTLSMFMEAGVEAHLCPQEFSSLVPIQQMRPLRWTGAYEVVQLSTDSTGGSTPLE